MHLSVIPSFVVCTVTFGLALAATFSAEWLLIYKEHKLYGTAGIFRICADEECILAGTDLLQTHGLRAVLVFCIFSVIFLFSSVILCGVGMIKRWRNCFQRGGACSILGALMSLIATAIYTTENPLSEAPDGFVYYYGFSYAFSWIVVVLGLIGGGMTFVFQNRIKSTSVPPFPRNMKRRIVSHTNTSSSENAA